MKNPLYYRNNISVFIFALLLFASCNKENREVLLIQTPAEDPITQISKVGDLKLVLESRSENLTEEEQKRLLRLRQAAFILFEIVKTGTARSVIMDGIRSQFYEDESILFKDLFNSSQSAALQLQSRQEVYNGYQNKLQNGNYMNSHEFDVTPTRPGGDGFDLISFLECGGFQIYWPYSDNWDNESTVLPIITYDPIEQEDVNIGWKLIPTTIGYTFLEVIVNDEYAQNNPVWIVNVYDGDKINENCDFVTENPPTLAYMSPKSGHCAGFPDDRIQVDIGKVKFFKQYDGVFRGGPDFRWVRGNLTLDASGNVTGIVPAFAKANLKRTDIYKWKNSTQPIWDTNWKVSKEDQFVALYEEDDFQDEKVSVSGTVSYKNDPNTTTATSYTYTGDFKSKDEVIYNVQYDRCWYFETSDDNTPFENYQGWNVRGSQGEAKWTMPYHSW